MTVFTPFVGSHFDVRGHTGFREGPTFQSEMPAMDWVEQEADDSALEFDFDYRPDGIAYAKNVAGQVVGGVRRTAVIAA